ncbi:MAG TPA: tetratricopeptide repeat protein, partial [Verrucomicrobiae bacterium]|nr:tetratricopeptide repeat protein [Verrucomicrobiae bacterium]
MQKPLLWFLLGLGIVCAAVYLSKKSREAGDKFSALMSRGQGYLEKGDATNAEAIYTEAVGLAPESIDARLNLANAYLLSASNQAVLAQCQEVLNLDHNSAAAYYLMGCAYMHLDQPEKAVQSFQESQKIDPAVTALNFQLGLAQERLGHTEEAIQEFETVTQFEPEHPSAHYQLSRLYQQAGRAADAAAELAKHQAILAKNPKVPPPPLGYERCKYTEPRVAFVLDQPDAAGNQVRFALATAEAFGPQAQQYHGPMGVLDFNHDGRNSLFVVKTNGFQLLENVNGKFTPRGETVRDSTGGPYRACLVGDLNNDRFEDVILLGEQSSHAFRFATNGQFREVTAAAGLKNLQGREGVLADLDFTGKLDLLAVLPGGQGLRVLRNLGSFYFQDFTNSGLPGVMPGTEHV